MSNEIQTSTQPQPARRELAPVSIGSRGLQFGNYDELVRFCETVSKSGLAPKGIETPQAIFVAVQMGLEVGLSPMAALQNIAVINGRPTIWGDAQLAIVRASGELEEFSEWYEQAGQRLDRNPTTFTDETAAVCRVKRRGHEPLVTGFSVADAKAAGLWGKQGPWTQYRSRMLRFRARSFGLRDTFGDALKGFRCAEEVRDEVNVTPENTAARLFGFVAPDDTTSEQVETPKAKSPKQIRTVFIAATESEAKVMAMPTTKPTASTVAFTKAVQADLTVTEADPYTLLESVIDSKGTISDFVRGMVADGVLGTTPPQSIKTVSDIPLAVVKQYVGKDGKCVGAIQTMEFALTEGVAP